MSRKVRMLPWLLIFCGILVSAGCITPKTKTTLNRRVPMYLDKSFGKYSLNKIIILRVMDVRHDKGKVDLDAEFIEEIDEWIIDALRGKGYDHKSVFEKTLLIKNHLRGEDIYEMDPKELAALGTMENKTGLLFIFIEDLESTYAVAEKWCHAEVSASLINIEDGRLLWKDRSWIRLTKGGLVGSLTPCVKKSAKASIEVMLSSLP